MSSLPLAAQCMPIGYSTGNLQSALFISLVLTVTRRCELCDPVKARKAPSARLLAAEHDAEHVGLHDVHQVCIAGLRQQAILVRVRARVIDPGWRARPSLLQIQSKEAFSSFPSLLH